MRSLLPIVVSAAALTGCFYDSRMGQARAAQRAQAAHMAPAELAPAELPSVAHRPPQRVSRPLRVRVLATPAYAAQVSDTPAHLRATFGAANQVLEPGVGLRLEAEPVRRWEHRDGEDHLEDVLRALEAQEPGSDVDLVVGLVGSMPRVTASFHEEGMARLLGKHMVLRASSRLSEHEVARTYDELSEDERDTMVRQWRRHRATTVLLHEVGHLLGATHEADDTSVMNAAYGRSRSRFGEGALRLMRATVACQVERCTNEDTAKRLLGELESIPAESFDAQARTELVALLEARRRSVPPPEAPRPTLEADVRPELRDTWAKALEARAQGDWQGAVALARPIFESHGEVLVVQETRCKWALESGASGDALRRECAAYNRLLMGPRREAPKRHSL